MIQVQLSEELGRTLMMRRRTLLELEGETQSDQDNFNYSEDTEKVSYFGESVDGVEFTNVERRMLQSATEVRYLLN
jgi:hypothetical protein